MHIQSSQVTGNFFSFNSFLDRTILSLQVNITSFFFFLVADMSGKVIVVFALLVALLVFSAAGEAEETKLQQLLAKREKVRGSADRQKPAPQASPARMERRAHLSEDEREIMTKQIMQAISGMLWVGV